MSTSTREPFVPDWAFPPGAVLAEWLEENYMTQAEFARRLDKTPKFVNQLVAGKVPLTRHVAADLASVTGIRAQTWNTAEANYRDTLDRMQRDTRQITKEEVAWLDRLPLAWMRKQELITATKTAAGRLLDEALAFFQVSNIAAWEAIWDADDIAAFRKSESHSANPAAVATWLQVGRLDAARRRVPDYAEAELRSRVDRLRRLVTADDLVTALTVDAVHVLAEAGVVLIYAPTPPGAPCSAATRWNAGNPTILMSLRHTSDDHIWFSLFHEIGHIIFDRNRNTIEANDTADDSGEHRANEFARDVLIPRDYASRLAEITTIEAAKTFADEIGVAPGIVVGRLQHDHHWTYRTGNTLKRRVKWAK